MPTKHPLIGKRVAFFKTGRRQGWRTGRVTRVSCNKDLRVKSATVRIHGPDGPYKGPRMRITRQELSFTNHNAGVIARKNITPLETWEEENLD